jgi:hypothetical protein
MSAAAGMHAHSGSKPSSSFQGHSGGIVFAHECSTDGDEVDAY